MEVSPTIPPGPVRFGTPEWREMFAFAVAEASRLGLKIKVNNDAGWAGSGGPWVKPEFAQQKLVWSETSVRAPSHFDAVLPEPAHSSFYRDVAVLAFPTPAHDGFQPAADAPRIRTNTGAREDALKALITGSASIPFFQPKPDAPQYVQFDFSEPFTARTLSLTLREVNVFANGNQASPDSSDFEIELQASEDGQTFRTIAKFQGQLAASTLSFPSVTARSFRVVFLDAARLPKTSEANPPRFLLQSLVLSPGARVTDLARKTFVTRGETTPQDCVRMDTDSPPTPGWLARNKGDSRQWIQWRNSHIGTVDSWLQWLLDGKPSPSGRVSFSNWRL